MMAGGEVWKLKNDDFAWEGCNFLRFREIASEDGSEASWEASWTRFGGHVGGLMRLAAPKNGC